MASTVQERARILSISKIPLAGFNWLKLIYMEMNAVIFFKNGHKEVI
jgi:hypothetical protein